MTSLDDLFKQIIHTERRAQERRNFLNEVKLRVQQLKEKIQETEQECICMHGKLASKVQQLNEEDLSWKILQNKEKTLVHQIEILTSEKKEVEKALANISLKKKEETDCFCIDVEDFINSYSLTSNGHAVREQQAQQNLMVLREKYDKLKKAHHNYSEKKRRIEDLQEQYQLLVREKENLNRQSQELDSQAQTMQQLTEDQKKTLNSPITDPEFVKLQHQLECLKNENLEEECKILQKEMMRLQHLCWQKQVKQRQKQQDLKRQRVREQVRLSTGLQHQLECLKNENLEEECKILQKEMMRLQHLCWQKQVKQRQKQQDLKRQRVREQNTVPVLNTSNKIQLSNFTSESTKPQGEELSDHILQDILAEDFTQISNQKSLFRKN